MASIFFMADLSLAFFSEEASSDRAARNDRPSVLSIWNARGVPNAGSPFRTHSNGIQDLMGVTHRKRLTAISRVDKRLFCYISRLARPVARARRGCSGGAPLCLTNETPATH
jgi:hypothetical protein